MLSDEIQNLKHITLYTLSDETPICRYEIGILHPTMRRYHPACILNSVNDKRFRLFDFSSIANELLKRDRLTEYDVLRKFNVNISEIPFKFISELTFKQVQQIIDNNYTLFSQLTNLIKENDLIEQLK